MIESRSRSQAFATLTGDLLARGVGFRFVARGRSMLPRIADGDILHVRPAHPAKIRVGDIVMFKAEREFKAHRVIGRYGSTFFTRGDAAQDYDLPIRGDEILGRVVAKECSSTGRVTCLCCWRERLRFLRTRLQNSLASPARAAVGR